MIDGPNSSGKPRKYSSEHDQEFLDEFICVAKMFPNEPAYDIDYRIIDQIDRITSIDQPSFTYVIKYGCHFMYEHDYPQSAKIFEPTISDLKQPTLEEIMNSYHNAMRWSVDGFFRELLLKIDDKDVLILYTSDHGQSIEEYKTLPATHCVGKGAPCSQARVPMFMICGRGIDSNLSERLRKAASDNHAKSSHYNLVPSLLYFMGYGLDDIHRKQGLTLLDKLDGRREFITGGIYGRGFFEKREYEN